MSKVSKIFVLFFLCMILCCSCKQNKEDNEPDYTIFNPSENKDDTPNPTGISIPTDANIIDNQARDTINRDESQSSSNINGTSAQEQWPYPLDFKGITPTGTNKSGNLSINIKDENYPLSNFICPDVENNIFYYVNYGTDNYIYQIKDGVSSLILEKEAYFLNLWDNKLYFICKNDNSISFLYGDIYSYNLNTKKLQLLKKANAQYLIVDSFGIYYEDKVDFKTGKVAFYRLDLEGKELKQLDGPYIQTYYQYQLIVNANGVFLFNSEAQDEIYLAPIDYYGCGLKIYDDFLIFNKNGSFYMLNLLNGEKNIVNWVNKKIVSPAYDYILIENTIYLPTGLKIDIANGDIKQYRKRFENNKDNFETNYLYTDRSKIYAIVTFPSLGNLQKLIELKFDDQEYLLKIKELSE